MFDWREYLDLAEDLQRGAASGAARVQSVEAAQRCAVSRAYYAAFCHARNYAQANLGFTPTQRGADHWLLQQHLVSHGLANVARQLRRLHGWCKQCDYEDTVPTLNIILINAVRDANAIISRL
jgi:hypothetical protein